jgi:osmotically inducible lipoprotein OsmB
MEITMKHVQLIAALAISLAVTACGDTKGDRALSGGALGAGAGAILGGTNGALIGGAAGAATGALTNKSDVNLGKPVWR